MAKRSGDENGERDHNRSVHGECHDDTQVDSDTDPYRTDSWGHDKCEQRGVRDAVMPAAPLYVDAGKHGGIVVDSWDLNEILVSAIVRAYALESARARQLVDEVQVQAGGGRVYATGPNNLRHEVWLVSYRINVPRKNDLDLKANNGGSASRTCRAN